MPKPYSTDLRERVLVLLRKTGEPLMRQEDLQCGAIPPQHGATLWIDLCANVMHNGLRHDILTGEITLFHDVGD
jgi:hypothetical protein